jgi:Ca2+-binding RTX toxin-like protein
MSHRPSLRATSIVASAVALLALLPAAASAATLTVDGSTLRYASNGSEKNSPMITLSGDYTVIDPTAESLNPVAPGCSAIDAITATCSATGVDKIDMTGGIRPDVMTVDAPTNASIRGGSGPDTLTGGAGDDKLDGENGPDALDGGLGADTFTGGGGDDVIQARDEEVDTIACGSGIDSVVADAEDSVAADCETVDVTLPPPPPVVDPDPQGDVPRLRRSPTLPSLWLLRRRARPCRAPLRRSSCLGAAPASVAVARRFA